MGNKEIKLNKKQFSLLVADIKTATDNLDPQYGGIELSGNMPSMTEVVDTFDDISQCIRKCSVICYKLINNLNKAADAREKQDKILAEEK